LCEIFFTRNAVDQSASEKLARQISEQIDSEVKLSTSEGIEVNE
jgi:hypothetical protein